MRKRYFICSVFLGVLFSFITACSSDDTLKALTDVKRRPADMDSWDYLDTIDLNDANNEQQADAFIDSHNFNDIEDTLQDRDIVIDDIILEDSNYPDTNLSYDVHYDDFGVDSQYDVEYDTFNETDIGFKDEYASDIQDKGFSTDTQDSYYEDISDSYTDDIEVDALIDTVDNGISDVSISDDTIGEDTQCIPNWVDSGDCDCIPTGCNGCTGSKPQNDGCGNTRYVTCSKEPAGCNSGEVCYNGDCCRPDCTNRECGDDGCGGSCGNCNSNMFCINYKCELQNQCSAANVPQGSFGLNYAVPYHIGGWYAQEWDYVQSEFQKDLHIMLALGAKVVRIMVLPYYSGMKLEENKGNVGDPVALSKAKENIPKIINLFKSEGIAVILTLGPNAYYWNGPDTRKWWEWAYGSNGWSNFVKDLTIWAREIIYAIESSSSCSGILYYDILNEADYRVAGMSELVRSLVSQINIPQNKLGISVLYQSDITPVLNDFHSQNREPAYLDIHSYPDRDVNSNPQTAINSIVNAAPNSKPLLGEFAGIYCENGQDEDLQASTETSIINNVISTNALAFLHWMLWDYADDNGVCGDKDHERTGFGFSPEKPRDNYGAISNIMSAIKGGDFEGDMAGWYMGGTGSDANLSLGGPLESDAATNKYYLRLQITGNGTYWVCSPTFIVNGHKVALSGYIRSNTSNVDINVHYRDTNGWTYETNRQPIAKSIPIGPNWQFYNIQYQWGGISLELPSGALEALICFVASSNGNNVIYVDLDAISINTY